MSSSEEEWEEVPLVAQPENVSTPGVVNDASDVHPTVLNFDAYGASFDKSASESKDQPVIDHPAPANSVVDPTFSEDDDEEGRFALRANQKGSCDDQIPGEEEDVREATEEAVQGQTRDDNSWRESDADTLDPQCEEAETSVEEEGCQMVVVNEDQRQIDIVSEALPKDSEFGDLSHVPPGVSADGIIRVTPTWSNFPFVLLLCLIAFYGAADLASHLRSLSHSVSSEAAIRSRLESFHMDTSLSRSWKRELKSCEGRSCCFSMFILAGHAPSHELAIRELLRRSGKAANSSLVEWSRQDLTEALDSLDKFSAMSKLENREANLLSVFLVGKADNLKARDIQKLYQLGTERCSSVRTSHKNTKKKDTGQSKRRGQRDEEETGNHMIVVLSTSFGKDSLLSPEDVITDRYMEEARFARRDWFALSGLVMNQHHILHGVKGFQPREVFERFFLANSAIPQQGFGSGIPDQLFRWFQRTLMQHRSPSSIPRADLAMHFSGATTGPESWLESKRGSVVVTKPGWKVLQRQLARAKNATAWLEDQYALWTRGDRCKAVLHKQLGSDRIAHFQVFCNGGQDFVTA